MFMKIQKESYNKKNYNITSNNIKANNNNEEYNENDYIIKKEENYYKYNKTTTQVKTYEYKIQKRKINEFLLEKDYIDSKDNTYLNNINNNKIYSKSFDRKEKNNIQYNNKINSKLKLYNNNNNPYSYKKKLIFNNHTNNINSDNFKVLNNNNIDLIKKKKELEEKRERERKILEWFYINDINISKRDLYDALTTLIQSVFRGWLFRSKHNIKIKNGILLLNKVLLKVYKKNLEKFFSILKNLRKVKNGKNEKDKMYEEIKELIKQNNELQKKLGNILMENKNLKNETEKYKDYKNKYKEIFERIEKMYNVNNNIIEENQNLKNELNKLKTNNANNNINKEKEKHVNNNYSIDKLSSINYLQMNNNKKFKDKKTQYDINLNSNKNIYYNTFEIQNLNQINIFSKNNPTINLICKENNINLISIGLRDKKIKEKNRDKDVNNYITNELNIYKNKLKNIIIKYNINKKENKYKDRLKEVFFKYKNIINYIKIKELENEISLLKKEKNDNKTQENNTLKQNKLKSIFRYKSSIFKNDLHKFFLLFYYKGLSTKPENKIQIQNENLLPPTIPDNNNTIPIVSQEPINASEIPSTNIENNNNTEINSKEDENNKIKKEKEEMEKKARIKKARNLRRLLNKKVHEKKDNLRRYFYKYQHIIMMMKIRNKLIEMKKREIEKNLKEEKIENAKYRYIQLQRDKQQRIAAIFNKLDKKISQIKRTVLEAWNMKAKVMSIKTILQPLNNKTKKKKKKSKKEKDNSQEIIKDKN